MKPLLICLAILVLVGSVGAVITTQPSGGNTSNSVNLASTGATTPCWFEWGQQPGYLSWKTPNGTAASCLLTTVKGSPLNGNTVFYYRICDTTGCGAELSFVTSSITPMPTTTYKVIFDNLTESGFDIQMLPNSVLQPYLWVLPDPMFRMVIFGLLFMGIFIGLWQSGRGMVIPVILGLLAGSSLLLPGVGLMMGIPPEWNSISMSIVYAGLAGIAVYIFKK